MQGHVSEGSWQTGPGGRGHRPGAQTARGRLTGNGQLGEKRIPTARLPGHFLPREARKLPEASRVTQAGVACGLKCAPRAGTPAKGTGWTPRSCVGRLTSPLQACWAAWIGGGWLTLTVALQDQLPRSPSPRLAGSSGLLTEWE